MKLAEAKYAHPNKMTRVGILHFDDRKKDEYMDARNVSITFRMTRDMDDSDSDWSGYNAKIIDISHVDGGEVSLAKHIGIKRDTEAIYQLDRHGWMLSGWRMGPGTHSPWSLEKYTDLSEAQYQGGDSKREQAYVFEMTEHFYNDKDVQHALAKLGPTEVNWTQGLGVQSNTRIGYVDAYTTLSQAEKVHTILQKIFYLKADQEVDYPLRAYGGYQSYGH